MAQIALTFDLCVWDVKSLTLRADTIEELMRNSQDIALNGALWWLTAQTCEGASVLAPIRWQWAPVRLYRLEFKLASVDGCRRDKNSPRDKELSLWIAQVHLDTAPGLHLAPLITHCLTHIWEYTSIYIRVYSWHLHTGILYIALSAFTLISKHFHLIQDVINRIRRKEIQHFFYLLSPTYTCRWTMFMRHWPGRIRTNPFLRVAGNVQCLLNRHRLWSCSEAQGDGWRGLNLSSTCKVKLIN